jgi:hypothetical protein
VLLASFVAPFFSSQAFVFLPPVRLMLTLTPRVLGTLACVCCFCECFFRMKKLSHGSGSHSLSDGMPLDIRKF